MKRDFTEKIPTLKKVTAMTPIAAYDAAKSALKNPDFSSFVVFAAWMAAIMSGSVLVILAGLVAYLRPLLLASLLSQNIPAKKVVKTTPAKSRLFSAFSFSPAPLGLAA